MEIETPSGAATDTMTINCSGFPDQILSNDTFDSTLVVQVCNMITVGPAYTIQSPADLTLRTPGSVKLGDGTTVESGTVHIQNDDPQ